MSVVGSLGTKISPPAISSRPRSTSATASAMPIQNRVMRSSVIVIRPSLHCDRNSGITLPAEPMTLP